MTMPVVALVAILAAGVHAGTWDDAAGTFSVGIATFVVTGGKVGVGTGNPGAMVDVTAVGSANSLGFRATNASGTVALINFLGAGGYNPMSAAGDQGLIFYGSAQNSGALVIAPWSTSSSGIRMTAAGNVGIGVASPARPLDVSGGMKSTMWNVTQVLNATAGPMTVTSGSFSTNGGTLILFASGSGYGTAGTVIGMNIQIDGTNKGIAKSYTNEGASHKAFVANALVVTGIASGSHTVSCAALSGTSSDTNDFFSVTVMELPF